MGDDGQVHDEPTAGSPGPEPVQPGSEPATTEPEGSSAVAPRRLQRSRDDRVIAGVCGGIGEYFGIDPVLARIAALVLVFAGGAGIVLYVIGWIAMPEAPEGAARAGASTTPAAHAPERTSGAVALGLVFVVLGAFFLLDELWPDFFSWQYVWPIVLIAIGAAILLRARR